MSKQIINVGQSANDRSGDPLRNAFEKVNSNFTELYNAVAADVQIPAQTSNSGKYLTTNGTTLSWDIIPVPSLISSGNTAPGSAVVANSTNISINFSDGGSNKFVFNANGKLQLAVGGDIIDSTGASVLGTPITDQDAQLFTTGSPTFGTLTIDTAGTLQTFSPGVGSNYFTLQGANNRGVAIQATDSENMSTSWLFGIDGKLTLPGAVVNSTVAKTGSGAQPPLYLGDSTYPSALVDGNYGPFTLSNIVFTVQVLSGSPIYTITNVLNNATFTLNQVIGTLDAGDLGGTPGNTTNIDVATLMPLALDLTKTVNKLTNGVYTLADGVEGQIMYLVRQTGATSPITVIVANARVSGSQYTTLEHYPFTTGDINMLIFTDGHWQANSGTWD